MEEFVNQRLPEPLPQQQLPAHHRPPNIVYFDGVPYHVTRQQPTQVIVQMPPPQSGMSQTQRDLVVTVTLILAVIVVCTGAVCAVVVIAGGTLMGIIGVAGQNLPFVGVSLIGLVVAVGWAAGRLRGLVRRE
ncbi:hypothetical protein [Streptomyces ipomoeae]|jgi:nitric oxide reductase large subunit|uniref:hypothetical protein n=1 Tax=Streptomyces ipomoeae TaxID=103232 RepID=UPI0029BAA539|nr:hypothetical protein [Streptomyces ipomoeae]MDX2697595.1 hypothetical protein [Streptomyces ipomoeae]MDX2838036.1 hypothetical protein [Streptomyces ipomoeae]